MSNIFCSDAYLLFQFRDKMWATVRYIVENQGICTHDSDLDKVVKFKDDMLMSIANMLDFSDKDDKTPVKQLKAEEGIEQSISSFVGGNSVEYK